MTRERRPACHSPQSKTWSPEGFPRGLGLEMQIRPGVVEVVTPDHSVQVARIANGAPRVVLFFLGDAKARKVMATTLVAWLAISHTMWDNSSRK